MTDKAVNNPVCGPDAAPAAVLAVNECLGPGKAVTDKAVNSPVCGPAPVAAAFAEKL